MPVNVKNEMTAIVVRGSFNHAIFHPDWFATNDLIREEEAKAVSDIDILSQQLQLARFSTDWLALQATQDRFVLETKDSSKYLPLRDLALGTFAILEHTPIRAFGFNCTREYEVETEDEWHLIGDHFAPKKSWVDSMNSPGLSSLVMHERKKKNDRGRIQITLEPLPIPAGNPRYGVAIRINEHYDFQNDQEVEQPKRLEFMLEKLGTRWPQFLKFSETTSDKLLEKPFKKQE